jgi:phage I-like protein
MKGEVQTVDEIERTAPPEPASRARAISRPAGALEGVMREQVLSRLQEAIELADSDLVDNLNSLEELLRDLADQVAALDLVRRTDAAASATNMSLLSRTAVPTAGGEPVREFLLIPFGTVEVERPFAGDSFTFTREHAEAAQRWFESLGRKLAIDYEHQSFDELNTRPDGLRPAAGWIGGLEVREDGLWAVDVTWTPRAAELLRNGEYRYFSPVIFWADEERTQLAGLGPVALTNDPAMRGVPALAARRRCENDGALNSLRRQLEAARSEIALLKKKLAAQEAEAFVERGMRLGKILDCTSMDWRQEYLRDPQAAEEKLARSPVLLPQGRLLAVNQRGEVEGSAKLNRLARVTQAMRKAGLSAEDLVAYQEAVAAGRVVHVARGG